MKRDGRRRMKFRGISVVAELAAIRGEAISHAAATRVSSHLDAGIITRASYRMQLGRAVRDLC